MEDLEKMLTFEETIGESRTPTPSRLMLYLNSSDINKVKQHYEWEECL